MEGKPFKLLETETSGKIFTNILLGNAANADLKLPCIYQKHIMLVQHRTRYFEKCQNSILPFYKFFTPIWVHPFSTHAKFSEKLTFLTPRYAQVRVRLRGEEKLVVRKILVHTK